MALYHTIYDPVTGTNITVPFSQQEIAEYEAAQQAAFNALTEDDYAREIQRHIDDTARVQQYADGFALASYVNSTIPKWSSEATTFVAWRDQVWVYAYQELAKVQSGQRPKPTIEALIAELPQIAWPS